LPSPASFSSPFLVYPTLSHGWLKKRREEKEGGGRISSFFLLGFIFCNVGRRRNGIENPTGKQEEDNKNRNTYYFYYPQRQPIETETQIKL